MIILFLLVQFSGFQTLKHPVAGQEVAPIRSKIAVHGSIPHGTIQGDWDKDVIDSPLAKTEIAKSLALEADVMKRIPQTLLSLHIKMPKINDSVALIAKKPSTGTVKTDGREISTYDQAIVSPPNPQLIAWDHTRGIYRTTAVKSATLLISEGRAEDAQQELEAYRYDFGQDSETSCLLFDALIRQGKYRQAYEEILGFLRKNVPLEDQGDFSLRVSLAAALNGEIYRGQKEFAFQESSEWDRKGACETNPLWPVGTNASTIAAMSAYDLSIPYGYKGEVGLYYFDLAEALDPGEPLFDRGLVQEYVAEKEFQKAIDLAYKKLKATQDPGLRINYTQMFDYARQAKQDYEKLRP